MAVNFHQLETPKTSNPVAPKKCWFSRYFFVLGGVFLSAWLSPDVSGPVPGGALRAKALVQSGGQLNFEKCRGYEAGALYLDELNQRHGRKLLNPYFLGEEVG